MVGQILPNNNERCYSNFLSTFQQLNTPYIAIKEEQQNKIEFTGENRTKG
jgi:hypothetical protein